VARLAEPPDKLAVPRVVSESRKVAVPLGVPALLETVVVNVTDWPNTDGLADELTAVEDLAWFTIWVRLLLLPAKLASPV
jgi:hypothetical protein